MTRRGLARLRFELGGEDISGAEARITRDLLERHLAVSLLGRAVFHGQADLHALLEVKS